MKSRLVLIGNGMAGVRCVEEILALEPDRFDITIIGSEPHTNYNRILLSKVLQGNTSIEDITMNTQSWYDERGIVLHKGEEAVAIDTGRRRVRTSAGREVDYDKLILATGSDPFMLPLPGADKPGVLAFRNIKDCNALMEASRTFKRAVVIGGGLLGLEAARGLLNLGMDVSVVHIHGYIMERQLDRTASDMLRKELEGQGMRFLLEKQSERILGRKRVEGLQFKDGARIGTDLVVFAVGIRPNVKLAAASGIETNRAVVVNDYMETNVPGIYAVGECAEHRGIAYGLVAPLYEQGKVLAKAICGRETGGYAGSTLYSQLKVSGVDVFSAGEIRESADTVSIMKYDGLRRTYSKITLEGTRIAGAVLFGDTSQGNGLLRYIQNGADVSVFEEAESGGAASGVEYAATMPDAETVCSCNGVTKGALMSAVCEQGLKTLPEVRDCTRASSSCGGCKPVVEAIIAYALANGLDGGVRKRPVCGCTDMSHEELREAIHANAEDAAGPAHAESVGTALGRLGWSTAEGCGVCVPAVRYYSALAGAGRGAVIKPYWHCVGSPGDGSARIEASPGLHAERAALRDSVAMSEALESRLAGVAFPTNLAVGVSASPLHLAGTLAKDLGLAGAPGGWELYAGGSDGRRTAGAGGGAVVRLGELLLSQLKDEDALEISLALLQWYRMSANYGQPVGEWLTELGLVGVRERLLHPSNRQLLLAELGLAVTAGLAPEFEMAEVFADE
ncbi:nitrite reductase large subunit NirB [Paenibacillus sp. PAMC21692]|uniref:nitrite reductase large subunit NirB n=1 Tax=Paenibacillus sp. PAMC21692 TaxID=2762320 RepID=UPI00164DDF90|nr:nitrite reductase large subunit NirB [Paenibacillus sp. PAMC21692]QNK57137.1 NAD(P)/FAD-dependent oxidoreductase [Paenibacillus sp. PAMC21692]